MGYSLEEQLWQLKINELFNGEYRIVSNIFSDWSKQSLIAFLNHMSSVFLVFDIESTLLQAYVSAHITGDPYAFSIPYGYIKFRYEMPVSYKMSTKYKLADYGKTWLLIHEQ